MNNQSMWIAEASADDVDRFLSTVWAAVKSEKTELPDDIPAGIGDIAFGAITGGFAVDRDNRFAAFQWFSKLSEKNLLRIEAFYVCPASSKPRACLRIVADNNIPIEDVPEWWMTAYPSSVHSASHKLPTFLELVSILASKGNVSTSSADMSIALAEKEHEAQYYKKLADELAEDVRLSRARLRDGLKLRNEVAEASAFQNVEAEEAVEVTDLSGMPEWAEKNKDRIVIHQRALNSSKKSKYQNPAAIYASLELLAGPYREHRSGKIDKEAFQAAMGAAGVQIEGSIGATAGRTADAYNVMFEGRRRMLDFHVLKGGGRDERYCMRIYFFWDADLKKVVVGWMPSHLDNSLT